MHYDNVKLTPEESAKMRSLTENSAALQGAMKMFVETGERRMQQLQEQGREFYATIAEKYHLDLKHVEYVPSQDGSELVPVGVRLVTQGEKG